MAAEAPSPARAASSSPPPSSSAARELPPTMLIAPSSVGSRRARRAAAEGGGRGRRKGGDAPSSATGAGRGGIGVDRLVEAVRVVGREVDPAVAGADILELAMAKGPMFSWLSYWPEEGYSKEDHPY